MTGLEGGIPMRDVTVMTLVLLCKLVVFKLHFIRLDHVRQLG